MPRPLVARKAAQSGQSKRARPRGVIPPRRLSRRNAEHLEGPERLTCRPKNPPQFEEAGEDSRVACSSSFLTSPIVYEMK